ncbi:MAG: glycosyltransferase family 4 protein [Candidatus Omnitrophota bacterium]
MEKINIIQIITRLDKGGSSKIVLELAKFLNRQDYLVKIISGLTKDPQEDLDRFSSQTGIQIIFINQLRRNPNPFLDLISFFRLYSVLKKERPQIVHTHTSKAGILGRWAARLAGVHIVVHMPHGHIFYGYFGRLKTDLFIFLEKLTAYITDKIVTLTEIGKNEHIKFGIAKDNKFISIHNGIELDKNLNIKVDKSAKREELHFLEEDYLVTMVGRLEPVKGHIYFWEAMKEIIRQFPQAKALIVGDGSLKKELENAARKLNIFNVVNFLGEREDVIEIISISDLIALPSLNEGFGLVLLEAGILGKPVVATKVGGIPEVVLDKITGILVPPKDSYALAEAIIGLLKDRELYNDMAKEAKKWVLENFSSDLMLSKFKNLYDDLLSQER